MSKEHKVMPNSQISLFDDTTQPPTNLEAELHHRYVVLIQEIDKHRAAYYDNDAPTVSDAYYDGLMQELRRIESAHPAWVMSTSPSRQVGGKINTAFNKVKHQVPMLSLQDVFEQTEVEAFIEQILEKFSEAAFVVEEKIDGLSLALRYRYGKLECAWTRGDGLNFGEDVTLNAREIISIPHTLNTDLPLLEIRGEIYLPFADFERINQERKLINQANASTDGQNKSLELFANPRNCAAGTLRQLDASVVRQRGLAFLAFTIQQIEGMVLSTHSEGLNLLTNLGFSTVPQLPICHDVSAVLTNINSINERRNALPYGIDGAVVKVNQIALQEVLGKTSKTPKWAIAYKYQPESAQTTIESINIQVGRTGRITPLAYLTPVELAGSTISRATLHNQGIITALDVRVGDTVEIVKSGDIIPAVTRVITERRPLNAEPYILPEICPECGEKLAKNDDEAITYCRNEACPARLIAHLCYFVGGQALDIKGLGEKRIERFVKDGFITSIPDIYLLNRRREELIKAQGSKPKKDGSMPTKSIDNMLASIEASKEAPLPSLLAGLGIAGVGKQVAISICQTISHLSELFDADEESLCKISGISVETSKSILEFFGKQDTHEMIMRLEAYGLNLMSAREQKLPNDSKAHLIDYTFAITGKFEHYKRSELAKILTGLGATVESTLTKKVNVLIVGSSATTHKILKAEQRGLEVWNESMLERKIQHNPDVLE